MLDYRVRAFRSRPTPHPADRLIWPERLVNAPLDLEIGCGVGWHPIQRAAAHPERRLIAIEHTRAKFDLFRSRLENHGELDNLRAIHADAITWIDRNLEPWTVETCFLLYPNPEPKAENKRWLRSPFMGRLLKTLRPEGELVLATNERGYFEEALAWARHAWKLEEVEAREIMPGASPRTHFEKKYLERGETCFEVRWRQRNESSCRNQ